MNVLTIAGQTFTEARRNRVFYSLFLFALVVVLSSIIFTEVTATTMDRVLKDTGLAAINVFALALTIFAGVGVINREIDRRSIYTVLAKPVSRFGYILGKYLGPGVDHPRHLVADVRGPAGGDEDVQDRHPHRHLPRVPGGAAGGDGAGRGGGPLLHLHHLVHLGLHLRRGVLLRAPLHRVPPRGSQAHGARRAVGEAIYYLVPNLDRFNFKYHATYDLTIASTTLVAVVLFGVAYSGAALLAAVIVFQRRDFR